MASQSKLGEAFVPIRATLDKLDGDLKQARSKVEGAMSGIGKIASGAGHAVQGLGTIALGALGGIAAAAGAAATGIAMLAANAEPLIGLQQGFAAVTARIGTSTDTMLKSLEEASGGLITDRQLMQSFNKAAALVSDDFASNLPDAMSLVRRASQATGQDMGFLFDSLVTGIGRVSPMILDNLGIQVQLAEVTDRAAQMFGKSTEELSKQEQQAALTEIVMEKLNGAYGDVPDITPTFGKIGTTIANLKDKIGLKLLPVLAPLVEKLLGLGEKVLPKLFDILDTKIIPVISGITGAFGGFIDSIMGGMDPLSALPNLISKIGSALGLSDEEASGLASTITNVITAIQDGIAAVSEFLQPFIEAIGNFVSWKDVALGLAIAIGSVLIPILWGLVAPMLPIIATAAALIGIIALLRNAWENDWGGIRTTLTSWWDSVGEPIFDTLVTWLQTNIPVAIQFLTDAWNNVLKPALEAVWKFLTVDMMPIWEALGELFNVTITLAITALKGLWENVLLPALEAIWKFISEKILPIFKGWSDSIGGVQGAIETVLGWIDSLIEKLKGIKLPDWLTPGSPTPFEMGLRGIADAMSELSNLKLPAMALELERVNASGGGGMAMGGFGNQLQPAAIPLDVTIQGIPKEEMDMRRLARYVAEEIERRRS